LWVNRYHASGLGLRRFAEQNRIAVNSLRYWIHTESHPKASKPVTAVTPRFQEIKLTGSSPLQSWAVEVSMPSGLAVRFNTTAKPAWIGSVVKALR
jgi:hypothetical protein